MAGSTYTPLATTTVSGSSTAYVVFDSISSAYTEIVISCSYRLSANAGAAMYFNSDVQSANTKYSMTSLAGSGTASASGRASNVSVMYINNYSGSATQMNSTINLTNYSSASAEKNALIRSSDSGSYVEVSAGYWRDTSAIYKITIYTSGAVFVSGSTFTLYGIAAA